MTADETKESNLETIECNTFFMLPVSLDVIVPAGTSQEVVQKALIERIMEMIPTSAPTHKPEHVVIRSTYRVKDTDYTLKMLGNGSVVPEAAPQIQTPKRPKLIIP